MFDFLIVISMLVFLYIFRGCTVIIPTLDFAIVQSRHMDIGLHECVPAPLCYNGGASGQADLAKQTHCTQ